MHAGQGGGNDILGRRSYCAMLGESSCDGNAMTTIEQTEKTKSIFSAGNASLCAPVSLAVGRNEFTIKVCLSVCSLNPEKKVFFVSRIA